MNKAVWMPHAGHLCVGNQCRFHLNTYINGYIVSTVGEYVPDSGVRHILRKLRGKQTELKGDAERYDFGFEEVGAGRLYETLVFPAKSSGSKCCPWEASDWSEIDSGCYNDAGDAYKGHLEMVKKYTVQVTE